MDFILVILDVLDLPYQNNLYYFDLNYLGGEKYGIFMEILSRIS